MLDMLTTKPHRATSPEHGEGIPSWGEAYVRYRPLLFSALSKLASRGFISSPDDSIDLIHDFFLEAWPGIASNYDPAKARLETYLYASFVQFARPRIVRQHRWRDRLVSPLSLASSSIPELQFSPPHPLDHDLAAVRAAILKLTTLEQNILAAYVSDTRPSERDIAGRFSLTRYQLRLRLADALGKMAVSLGEMSAMSRKERAIMLSLWKENRTVKETARILQMSTSEVRAMPIRLFDMLSGAVRSGKSSTDTGSHPAPASADRAPPTAVSADAQSQAKEMLVSGIASGMSEPALEKIREHGAIIFDFLESPQAEPFFLTHAEILTPEHLERLYSALGSQEPSDPNEAMLLDSFFEACEEDEQQIGRAFYEVLVPNLSVDLTRFRDRIFQGAPMIEAEQREDVFAQTSVRFGGPPAAELALYGITPVTVVEATQAVANLARRFCDRSGIVKNQSFILDKIGKAEGYSLGAVLLRETSVREIVLTCEVPEQTAERLFDWLTRVAEYAPSLFDGFSSELRADELRLTRTDKSIADLFKRWYHPPAAAAA